MVERMIDLLINLVTAVLTPAVFVSLIPLLIASGITVLLIHLIRVENRWRDNPPIRPLALFTRLFVVGFFVGFMAQALLQPAVIWMSNGNLPVTGFVAWVTCGAFTPFGSWSVHRLMLMASYRWGTGELAYKLKVKHVPGVHNTGFTYGEEPPSETQLFHKWKEKINAED